MGLKPADATFSPLGADQWNQIVHTKIAVIGDSLSAQWPLFEPTWPAKLQARLNAAGAKVETKTFATGSYTFFRANTVATYGTETAVEAVIGWKPDVVLVVLGGNDVSGADSRTITQIKSDATTLFADLAAGLPSAVLIMVSAELYDSSNFTTSTLLNKGVLPHLMTPKSSGILSGLETSEYLDDAVSTANRDILDDYDELITHIDAITGVEMLDINLFRVFRLGVTMVDRIHPTKDGQSLIDGYIIKGLRSIAAFTALVPVIATQPTGDLFEGEDPDEFFEDALVDSGDGYVDNTPGVLGAEGVNSQWGPGRHYHPDRWFMGYKPSIIFNASTTVFNSVGSVGWLRALVTGAAPNSNVTFSMDGGAFSGTIAVTDGDGNVLIEQLIGTLGLSNASHTWRYKIGTLVLGPFSFTVAEEPVGIGYGTGAGGTVTQLTNKSTGVTLNEYTGQITMNGAALAADTSVAFTLTNSKIAAGDYVAVQHVSVGTGGAYNCIALAAAGSATIAVRNVTPGSLSEAIVLKFIVFKAVTA